MTTAQHARRHARAILGAATTIARPAPVDSRAARLQAMTAQVRAVHGAPAHGVPGPWALIGFRIGADALRRLGATRDDARELLVTHRAPRAARYACVLDGLQASTGASPGKLNLQLEPVARPEALETVVQHRPSGRRLRYRLEPGFLARFQEVDYADFPAAARDLDALPDQALFSCVEWVLLRPEARVPGPGFPGPRR